MTKKREKLFPFWLDYANPGGLPYKSNRDDHQIIAYKPENVPESYGRVPYSFPPERGINSTITNDVTGTVHFNSNNDKCETLSSPRLSEGIVIHPGRTP